MALKNKYTTVSLCDPFALTKGEIFKQFVCVKALLNEQKVKPKLNVFLHHIQKNREIGYAL